MFPSTQSALRVQHVCRIPLGFFASSAYAAAHPLPTSLAELADHPLIGPDRHPTDLEMVRKLETATGRQARFALRTDNHPAQINAARAGIGIAVLLAPLVHRDLVRVLPEFTLGQLDTWIVTHEDLRDSPRIDAVFNHLVTAMRTTFG